MNRCRIYYRCRYVIAGEEEVGDEGEEEGG